MPTATKEPSALTRRATYHAFRSAGALLQLLPESVANGIARGAGTILAEIPTASRSMYMRHLQRILGRDFTDREVRIWAKKAFAAYGRYWVEGARLPMLPKSLIEDRMIRPEGFSHLVDAMEAGRGVVLALPHVGSWEWGGAWLAQQGYPMTAIAEELQPPELYEWFVAQRAAMGLTILPLGGDSGGQLLRILRDGGRVGLLCDRDIAGHGIDVEFFGEHTTLPGGPATLALRTGATLITAAVYSGPGHDHSAVVNPPIPTERIGSLRADVTRITQQVAKELEELIRRAPEQWHCFQPNWPSDRPAHSDRHVSTTGSVQVASTTGSAEPASSDDPQNPGAGERAEPTGQGG